MSRVPSSKRKPRNTAYKVSPEAQRRGTTPAAGPATPDLSRSRFVGREREIDDVFSHFRAGHRLVTVTGLAGIGKTRLALEVLGRADNGGFPNLAHPTEESGEELGTDRRFGLFCDLAAVRDAADLCSELCQALRVRAEEGDGHCAEQIGCSLSTRGPCLVVLDNLEQLDDAAIELVAQWLRMAPELRLLATSRRVLRLEAEQVFELGPLAMPTSHEDRDAEAMRLFFDRANRVEPTFGKSGLIVAEVVPLVRRLEGIPLALELAAAQMRRHTPRVLHESLGGRVLDLRSPYRDTVARHRTLRGAIESSWEKLAPWGQATLQQLTVFRSPFSTNAAEAVVDLTGHPTAPPVAEVVGELREASFLQRCDVGEPRWSFYAAIREFVSATTREGSLLRTRHAKHFLSWGESFVVRKSEGLVLRTDREHATSIASVGALLSATANDLRQAFEWFDSIGDPARALRMALVVFEATHRFTPSSARDVLTRRLDASASGGPVSTELLGCALMARANASRLLGAYREAVDDLERARGLLGGDRRVAVALDCETGRIAMEEGNVAVARRLLERALKGALAVSDPGLEGRARTWLAYVITEGCGDPSGLAHYDVAIERLRSVADGSALLSASVYRLFGRIHFLCDTDAIVELTSLLDLVREHGNCELEVEARVAIGWGRLERNERREALDSFETARGVAARAGLVREAHLVAMNRAVALDWIGDEVLAQQAFVNALECTATGRCARLHAMVKVLFAGLLARLGSLSQAETMLADGERAALRGNWAPILEVAAIQRGQLDLARSAAARVRGDESEAERLLRKSRMMLASRRQEGPADVSAERSAWDRPRSLLFRCALHCLERELDRALTAQPSLEIWTDGSAFRLAGGEVCNLPRGPAIRHVLTALAKRRLDQPGETLSRDDVLKVGWPGERVQGRAGVFRVHNVVTRLRRIGLRQVLQTENAGYRLDPSVPLSVVVERIGQ